LLDAHANEILTTAMKPRFFATPESFRNWLKMNHSAKTELLVGFYKVGSGKPSITWPQSVDQALCFGWIDGVRRSLGADAYTIRFTPRKATSIWSKINVARVAELERLGKMTAAGRRAFSARTPERTGVYSSERQEEAQLSRAETALLYKNTKARAFFEGQPPWYQRTVKHWIVSAKRPETRARRLAQLIKDSAAGRTVPPLTRPTGKAQSPG